MNLPIDDLLIKGDYLRYQFFKFVVVLVTITFESQNLYAQNAEAQANNPLANMTAFNIQNYYTGELTDTSKDANQFILRYAKPFTIGDSKWLMRASLPYLSFPSGHNRMQETGLGDADIFAAYLFNTKDPAISFGVGPSIVAPTASEKSLGAEQWQAGLANVYFNATSSQYQFGYLAIYRSGLGETNDRDRINLFAFQPFFFYQLGAGWYTGGAPIWNFNLKSGDFSVPLGVRLGKVIKKDKTVFNLFAEPQVSVLDEGANQPVWQMYFGLNMQFM